MHASAAATSDGLKPQAALAAVVDQIGSVILGKQPQIQLALTCLLARGHLLIEDLPGMGKTTLSQTLAKTLGLDHQRVQFTSDLLPADILGGSLYERQSGQFVFHPGPVFSQLVLADEINRASPKTQSALLEAMAERQVSIDGKTYPLPQPFFVIATQNPSDQLGAFELPESQLDRFLMRLTLGYPDPTAERALLAGDGGATAHQPNTLDAVINPQQLNELQNLVDAVSVADVLLDYLQNLLSASRRGTEFVAGLSPRAGLGLLSAARAWALLSGRDYVLPEDLQQVLPAVIGHRLRPLDAGGRPPQELAAALIDAVPVPA